MSEVTDLAVIEKTKALPALHGKEYRVVSDACYVDPSKKKLKQKVNRLNQPKTGTLLERLTHGAI